MFLDRKGHIVIAEVIFVGSFALLRGFLRSAVNIRQVQPKVLRGSRYYGTC